MSDLPHMVPIELVKRLATPTGLAFIIRAKLNGHQLAPLAQVFVRCGRFVADCPFIDQDGPERAVTVMLAVVPEARP